jgi:hypothetical protein
MVREGLRDALCMTQGSQKVGVIPKAHVQEAGSSRGVVRRRDLKSWDFRVSNQTLAVPLERNKSCCGTSSDLTREDCCFLPPCVISLPLPSAMRPSLET